MIRVPSPWQFVFGCVDLVRAVADGIQKGVNLVAPVKDAQCVAAYADSLAIAEWEKKLLDPDYTSPVVDASAGDSPTEVSEPLPPSPSVGHPDLYYVSRECPGCHALLDATGTEGDIDVLANVFAAFHIDCEIDDATADFIRRRNTRQRLAETHNRTQGMEDQP